MLLALKYRPRRFSELTGQNSARAILQALVYSGDVPPSIILEGTRGSGKTSAARVFAAALNCPNQSNGDNCGQCQSCKDILGGQSFLVEEIDAASNGGIEDVRALKDMVQFSAGGGTRVILLDEAHAMSRPAFNALLKVLEEPPVDTVFVLLTTEPNKIMETVRSRSMPVFFVPVGVGDVKARLASIVEAEGFAFDAPAVNEIALNSDGSLRDSIMLLDQCVRTKAFDYLAVRKVLNKDDSASDIFSAIMVQDHSKAVSSVKKFFENSADVKGLSSDLIEQVQLRFENNAINAKQMVTAMKFIWEFRGSLTDSASRYTRIQTEALVTLLYGVFYVEPKKTAPILKTEPVAPKPAPEQLTLESLAAIAEE